MVFVDDCPGLQAKIQELLNVKVKVSVKEFGYLHSFKEFLIL
jgi:hypothetical protein